MRKCLSVLLAVLLLAAAIPLGAVNVSAATSGNFTYSVSGSKVTITECNTFVSGDLTIPSTIDGYPVTTIGSRAFYGCSSLTSVTIPEGVTSIGSSVFSNCFSLTSVTIPNSVTSIGNGAFYECYKLTSVTIPEGVTSIGNSAFYSCSSLTSVTIPNSVTSIGSGAFNDCSSLTSVTIPSSVTTIGSYAFNGCSSLTSINVDSQNSSYSSIDGVLFNKAQTTLIQYPAKKAGTSYTIPDTVTAIGTYAFSYCSALTTVTIPDGVTSIDRYAFYRCSSLTSVTIPDGVTSIVSYAFYDCSSLTSVTIPNSVTSIGSGAFERCSALTSVTIPDGVTSIGGSAFRYCSALTFITIPEGVTSIGSYAFYNCSALTDVYYGGTEEDRANMTIGTYNDPILNATWHYAPSIPAGLLYEIVDGEVTITGYTDELPADLTIPATIESYPVTTIGDEAFSECSNLTSLTISDSVTTIGYEAFYGCKALTSIVIPDSVTTLGTGAFRLCSAATSVEIGSGITTISKFAFRDNVSLTSVVIPDTVESIGEWAFNNCKKLSVITIPANLSEVVEGAFYQCYALSDVYYGGTVEDRDNIAIGSDNEKLLNATWHCHEHTYDDNCDVDCNGCGDLRVAPHTYDNACDAACNGCGAGRTPADHVYDHEFDVDCNECGAVREMAKTPVDFGGNSVSEDVSGLAFKFDVSVVGMKMNRTTAIYDGATIDDYKLIKMGAIATNGVDTIDIPCVYLCDLEPDSCGFAVRIINIPTDKYDVPITSTPYFVIEVDGVQRTVYGETRTASYNNFS